MKKAPAVFRIATALLLALAAFSCNAQIRGPHRRIFTPASFAIAHDADSAAIACGNSATCTVPITVGAAAHNFLKVSFTCDAGFSGCSLKATGGVVDSTNGADFTANCTLANNTTRLIKAWLCWTTDVPSGANSIAITLNAAPGTSTFGASATSYTSSGVFSWDVAPVVFTTTLGSGTSISESITTLTANDWIVDTVSLQDSNGTAATATSPQVARWNNPINSTLVGGTSDHGPIATPGAVSDGWSYSASAIWNCFILGALKAR